MRKAICFLLVGLLACTVTSLSGQARCQAKAPVSSDKTDLPDQAVALGEDAFSHEHDNGEPQAPRVRSASSQPEAATDTEPEKSSTLSPRACLVTGRITQVTGQQSQEAQQAIPLSGVLITLEDSLGNVTCDVTNSLGVYLITVPPGSYLLAAERGGYRPSKAQEVTVRSWNALLPNVVLYHESAPASLDEPESPDQMVAMGQHDLSIESDGNPPKGQNVEYVSSQPEMATVTDADAGEISMPVLRASLVSGRVTDGCFQQSAQALGPVPLAGALISLEDPLGQVICDSTNSLGMYLISAPPGQYLLTAEKDEYTSPKPLQITVPSGSMVLPDLALSPEAPPPALSGTVTWGSEPLSMITVAIWSLTQGTSDTTWTEEDGTFLFEELPVPDSYVLEVCEEDLPILSSSPIWLTSQGARWDFHYPAGQICWQVTQDGNTPLPGAKIHLMGAGVDTLLCTDPDGLCETSACLQAGEFQVTISGDDQDLPVASYCLRLGQDENRLERVTLPTQHAPCSMDVSLERAQIILQEGRLQTGQPCSLRVQAYDDTGCDLSALLTQQNIVWSVLQGSGKIESRAEDPTRAAYVPQEAGQARIEATVTLNGVTVSAMTSVVNQSAALGQLDIIGPALPMIPNTSQATFRFVAMDTAGEEMSIRPRWDFQPERSGDLFPSRDGQEVSFVPQEDFIGQVRIFLTDSISGQTTEYNGWQAIPECDRGLSVYHLLTGGSPEMVLRDDGDFQLIIPDSALPPGDSAQIFLRKPSAPPVKRYTPRHQIHGQIYHLQSSGSIPFLQPVQIVLPVVPEARSLTTSIGRWDPLALEWVDVGATPWGDGISTEVDHFSQFAVLSLSDPLAVKDVQLLPNPFTPHDPYGLQLGFTLSTDRARKPFVTIKVYNMGGDLVRTICQNEPVPKGRYSPGESFLDSQGRDITRWDGRTDAGEMARNGRYLIHFQAEDSDGIVEALETAVLIK
jgi:hypothetical protein